RSRDKACASSCSFPVLHRKPFSAGRVADCFDIVAVRIEDEGAVIIRVVMRSETRTAIAAAADCYGRLVEGVHLRPCIGRERIMAAGSRLGSLVQPELRP